MDSLILPWVSAETMSIFLAEVARRHASEFIPHGHGSGWLASRRQVDRPLRTRA